MRPYLRLLTLRTRRRFLSMAFGLPALAPSAMIIFVLVADRFQESRVPVEAVDLMQLSCGAAVFGSVLAASHLTAFLVHDERTSGRSRLLRLATIDGRPPVVAHLGFAIVLAAASAGIGLGAAGLLAVAWGLPVPLWLSLSLWSGVVATVAGPIGVWAGYLLPRTVAMIAVQAVSSWAAVVLGAAAGAAVKSGTLSLRAPGWVVLAQLATFLLLPPLWRRTSARFW